MILLASKSKQRQEILKNLNLEFKCIDSGFDETPLQEKKLPPVELTKQLALGKLNKTIETNDVSNYSLVLTADTLIFFDDGRIMGKPHTENEARKMLMQYSNAQHSVVTSIAGYNPQTKKTHSIDSISKIWLEEFTDEKINLLINSGEWQGVAGAYRIQGLAALFVKKIEGSYSGIVGLPIYELHLMAEKLKVKLFK